MTPDQLTGIARAVAPLAPYLASLVGISALAVVVSVLLRGRRDSEGRATLIDRLVNPVAVVAVSVLGAGALYTSLMKVSRLASTRRVELPWLPGVLIDGAIAVFTFIELALARRQKHAPRWLGPLQWVLILVTVALNCYDEDPFGMLLHGPQPLLWKAAVAALKALIVTAVAAGRPVHIPFTRWLHAPGETWAIWRTMCTEAVDYPAAIRMHRSRRLVRAELLAAAPSPEHWWRTRWSMVPPDQRLRYRIHALAPAEPLPSPPSPPDPVRQRRASTAVVAPGPRRQRRSASPVDAAPASAVDASLVSTAPASTPDGERWWPPSFDERGGGPAYLAAGIEVARDLERRGERVNRDTLAEGLKARDLPAGGRGECGELAKRVKAALAAAVNTSPNGNGSTAGPVNTP